MVQPLQYPCLQDDPPSAARSNARTPEEENLLGGFAGPNGLLPLFGAGSVTVKQEPSSLFSQVLFDGGNGALAALHGEEALGSAVLSAPGMLQQQLPPGFESAARREHAAERQALAEAHEQEELEQKQIMVRLILRCSH